MLIFVTLALESKKKKNQFSNRNVLPVSLRPCPTSEINADPYIQNFIQQSLGIARFTEQQWEIL